MQAAMPSTRYQHTVDETSDTLHADEFDDDVDIGSCTNHASLCSRVNNPVFTDGGALTAVDGGYESGGEGGDDEFAFVSCGGDRACSLGHIPTDSPL